MSTLNRTFSVKSGIDVANTVVLDSSRNASNLASVNATSFLTSAGLDVTLQANTARDQANTAYGQANLAYGQANAAYSSANSAANTVRVSANSGSTLSGKQLNFVNTATAQISVTDSGNGNANITVDVIGGGAIGQAYAQANAAYDQANAAYGTANTANTTAKNAYAQANASYGQANAAYDQANAAYNTANTANTTGKNAYAQANTAYDQANLKLNLSGGTITGDLSVTGNIFIGSGNTTYINVTTYSISDPLLYVASNNDISDVVDIGIVGHYKDATLGNVHTGIVRHAADKKFYLFDGYAPEPGNNVVDINVANTATLVANIVANSITLGGATVATQANLTLAHNQANTARNTANSAYGEANAAYDQANTAYGQANAAYGQANAAYGQANAAYTTANTANTTAKNAYATANAAVVRAGDTMTGQLTISTTGTGLSVGNASVSYFLTVGSLNVTTNTVTTSGTGQVVLDKFPATDLASAKYFVQVSSSGNYHTTEMVLVQDATNVWITEYGSIQTGPSLGSFSADISSGSVRLLFTAVNATNTIRSVRYGIAT